MIEEAVKIVITEFYICYDNKNKEACVEHSSQI
jgi:hypothetical protein